MTDRPNPMDLNFWGLDESNKIYEFCRAWTRINLPDYSHDEILKGSLKSPKEWDELYQKWKKDNNIELAAGTVRNMDAIDRSREGRETIQ